MIVGSAARLRRVTTLLVRRDETVMQEIAYHAGTHTGQKTV
jgi:hypothetical protein